MALSEPAKSTTSAVPSQAPSASAKAAQNINLWSVEGAVVDGKIQAIDYEKLVGSFGTQLIDEALLDRFKRVTGQDPHPFMRRGLVFSHRDFGNILDRHEKGLPFFLYTARGPSSDSMHLGHMVPFPFTKQVLWPSSSLISCIC
jgi:tryptophanyl-tRNA synthetase